MTREEYWNLSEEERKKYDEEQRQKSFVLANVLQNNRENRHEDKESRKDETRNRIKNAYATVNENAVFIPAKKRLNAKDNDGERMVAVYARVSTKSEEQVSSIVNQTEYYSKKIENNPNWTMAEIYADEGKSGTSIRKRKEFQRMLLDAQMQKMDLILCASVSRFARNVTDCIQQIEKLRTDNPKHPVEVFFETEQISTLDPDATLNLQIHAILADWESANKSRRMILSYDQRICTGQYPVADLLGFRHTKDGDLIMVEDEAVTVKAIFLSLMLGYSYAEVADFLTEYERKTLNGRTEWNASMVRAITMNERRWGDLDVRKNIVLDYKKGKVVSNDGIRDKAFVPNHHEGIVTPEIAKAVHALRYSGDRTYGVTDIGVIDIGGLKGFVSFNPTFGGIDRVALLEISRSVYSEVAYEHLEQEARIINGEEHSNVIPMDFAGYHVANSALLIGRNTATLTISRHNLKFNKKCHEKMAGMTHVEFLYHPLLQAIIIRKCNEDSGIEWVSAEGKKCTSLSTEAFCKALYEQQDWIQNYSFRFRGVYRKRGEQELLIFYLDEPQIVPGKAVKKAAEAVEEEQKHMPFRYIPYRNSELAAEADTNCSDRQKRGNLYGYHRRRDDMISSLTEADLTERGVTVINPYIGAIPTREEIEQELALLIAAM